MKNKYQYFQMKQKKGDIKLFQGILLVINRNDKAALKLITIK